MPSGSVALSWRNASRMPPGRNDHSEKQVPAKRKSLAFNVSRNGALAGWAVIP